MSWETDELTTGDATFTAATSGGSDSSDIDVWYGQSLSAGPNGNRLAYWGDFNVEIDFNDLAPGLNVVTIRAYYASGGVSVDSVVVDHVDGVVVPPTYSIDWHQGIYTGLATWESDGILVYGPGATPVPVIGEPTRARRLDHHSQVQRVSGDRLSPRRCARDRGHPGQCCGHTSRQLD